MAFSEHSKVTDVWMDDDLSYAKLEVGTCVYVGPIPFAIAEHELATQIETQIGPVQSVQIVTNIGENGENDAACVIFVYNVSALKALTAGKIKCSFDHYEWEFMVFDADPEFLGFCQKPYCLQDSTSVDHVSNCNFPSLPVECLVAIMQYLPPCDLVRAMKVSRQWEEAAQLQLKKVTSLELSTLLKLPSCYAKNCLMTPPNGFKLLRLSSLLPRLRRLDLGGVIKYCGEHDHGGLLPSVLLEILGRQCVQLEFIDVDAFCPNFSSLSEFCSRCTGLKQLRLLNSQWQLKATEPQMIQLLRQLPRLQQLYLSRDIVTDQLLAALPASLQHLHLNWLVSFERQHSSSLALSVQQLRLTNCFLVDLNRVHTLLSCFQRLKTLDFPGIWSQIHPQENLLHIMNRISSLLPPGTSIPMLSQF